jgi:cysteine desulfurase/selenocysteine lyase
LRTTMNTQKGSEIPHEWLEPEFVRRVANAFYSGSSGEPWPETDAVPVDGLWPAADDQAASAREAAADDQDVTFAVALPSLHQNSQIASDPAGRESEGRLPDNDAAPSIRERYSLQRLYFVREPDARGETAPAGELRGTSNLHVEAIRQDFPALQQQVHGKPLIWLDNAATTQKPQAVIDAVSRFYERDNSNVHRGVHTLAERATDAYEQAREKVQGFLGARDSQEIIFVRGTTEAINLVAQSYGRKYLTRGDEIVLTIMEHHSNIVPWQLLCQETGAVLRVAPCNDLGEILLDEYASLLNLRTKLVALTQVSNVLGTVNPVGAMTQMAHGVGARVLIDGAQSIPHIPVNVQAINCDFFAFSGHKLFAPTGIGVLYGTADVLDMMPPWQGGGNMIQDVTFERTTYNTLPHKFEAGTGNIADAVGLGAAIDYLERIGFHAALQHEQTVLAYAIRALSQIPGLRLIGTAPNKVSTLSFVLEGIPNEELGRYLDREGIAVRAGHHCAQPIHRRFGLESSVRPSLAFYNTIEEIDALVAAIARAKRSLPSRAS